ncbi:hypothetical protein GX48_00045 [Paracoccidioides brasiliensis]|nr:hypothetical protein GX48_00045 [Paracoccidioides brasiliensis]
MALQAAPVPYFSPDGHNEHTGNLRHAGSSEKPKDSSKMGVSERTRKGRKCPFIQFLKRPKALVWATMPYCIPASDDYTSNPSDSDSDSDSITAAAAAAYSLQARTCL